MVQALAVRTLLPYTLPAQVYDMFPVVLGPLRTSALVPVLLAAFYLVLGSLFPLMGKKW